MPHPLPEKYTDELNVTRLVMLTSNFAEAAQPDHHKFAAHNVLGSHFQISFDTADVESASTCSDRSLKKLQEACFRTKLFNFDVFADGTLNARVKYKRPKPGELISKAGFYCIYTKEKDDEHYEEVLAPPGTQNEIDFPLGIASALPNLPKTVRLIEFGAFAYGPSLMPLESNLPIILVHSLVISPPLPTDQEGVIENIRIMQRESGTNVEGRLTWDWVYPRTSWAEGQPWSSVTGPFERFEVEIDGVARGESHCLELPLRDGDWGDGEGFEARVCVRGQFFGIGSVSGEAMIPATDLIAH